MKRQESVKNLMGENKILSVNQTFHLEISKLMQRVAIGFVPSPFTNIFENQERSLSVTTRSASNYYQQFMSAKKCQQSISYTGPLIWGNIPSDVKVSMAAIDSDRTDQSITTFNESSIKSFAKGMKSYSLQSIDFI